ncbi:Gfo/Idh/MocA family oxidoreductase [Agrobacterium rhizogenes]|nr:Gfo/Idh/MocA family oxidoreductase [Rhizobium rhizogenes]
MKTIRVGIAGYGWFGRIHAETWRSLPNVELVAICDTDASAHSSNSIRAQDAFHVGTRNSTVSKELMPCKAFTDVRTMIAESSLDLLDVVVPEAAHFEVAKAGLEAGLDVFVEKPFVTTKTESAALLQLGNMHNANIHVGHILRFDSRYRALIQKLKDGRRDILSMSLSRNFQESAHSIYGRTHPFFSACIHDIDVALWAMGVRPTRATAVVRRFLGQQQPDILLGLLEWESGATAVIQNAWHLSKRCPYGFTFESSFLVPGATYRIRNLPDLEIWSDDDGVNSPELFFWPDQDGERGGALRAELTHVADCVADGRPSDWVPLADVHAAICIAEALIASESSQSPVVINYD